MEPAAKTNDVHMPSAIANTSDAKALSKSNTTIRKEGSKAACPRSCGGCLSGGGAAASEPDTVAKPAKSAPPTKANAPQDDPEAEASGVLTPRSSTPKAEIDSTGAALEDVDLAVQGGAGAVDVEDS